MTAARAAPPAGYAGLRTCPGALRSYTTPWDVTPAGAKDDRRDALVLASALRTDRHCFRRLVPLDPLVVELREWSRMAEELKEERRAKAKKLAEETAAAKLPEDVTGNGDEHEDDDEPKTRSTADIEDEVQQEEAAEAKADGITNLNAEPIEEDKQ